MSALFGWLCIAAGSLTFFAYMHATADAQAGGEHTAYPSVWLAVAAIALGVIGLGLFII